MADDRYPDLALIYEQVEALLATKHSGPFAVSRIGRGYRHDFTTPAAALGVADGAVLITRDGQTVPIRRRSVLLVATSHLFGYRTYQDPRRMT